MWLVIGVIVGGRPGGDLAPVVEAEFVQDVFDVVFRGSFGNEQDVGYLAVGESSAEEVGDLALASGQLGGIDRARCVAQSSRERVGAGVERGHAQLVGEAGGVRGEDERLGPVPVAAPAQYPGQLEAGLGVERR